MGSVGVLGCSGSTGVGMFVLPPPGCEEGTIDDPPAPVLAGGVAPVCGGVGPFGVLLTGVPFPWLGSFVLGVGLVGVGVVGEGLAGVVGDGVELLGATTPRKSGTPSASGSLLHARLTSRVRSDEDATSWRRAGTARRGTNDMNAMFLSASAQRTTAQNQRAVRVDFCTPCDRRPCASLRVEKLSSYDMRWISRIAPIFC